MLISHYAAVRLHLAQRIAALLDACRKKGHRVATIAHHGEHAFHVAYLGGVAAGGGYRYAAMGLLACMAIAWLLHAEGD